MLLHHAPVSQPQADAKMHRIGVGIDTSRYGHYAAFLREDLQAAAGPRPRAARPRLSTSRKRHTEVGAIASTNTRQRRAAWLINDSKLTETVCE